MVSYLAIAIILNLDAGMFMVMSEYFTKREIPAGHGDVTGL